MPHYILPSPVRIGQAFVTDWPILGKALLVTLRITFLALAIALVSGVALAILMAQSRWIELALFPYAVILQVTPIVAIAPLILIYTSTTQQALLICAWLVAFFPVLSNTAQGLHSTDHNLLNLFELYGASRWQTLIHLRLPNALPYFLAGLRIAGGLALIAAVVAEFAAGTAGENSGLAFRLIEAQHRLNIPRLFAALVLLSLTGVAILRCHQPDLAPAAPELARERGQAGELRCEEGGARGIRCRSRLVLKNATVPAALVDEPAAGAGATGSCAPTSSSSTASSSASRSPATPTHYSLWEMDGRMVLPCFVDCHTHIDKGHIWPRTPNPDGTLHVGARRGRPATARRAGAPRTSRAAWISRCAAPTRTAPRRSAPTSIPSRRRRRSPGPSSRRCGTEWKGRIELQGVCLVTIELVRERAWFAALADRVAAARGVMGAATFMLPDLDALLDDVVRAAMERGLDLDFHADETADPEACALDRIADAVMRNGFAGRVLVGHCCSLARQADDAARATLDKVAKAGDRRSSACRCATCISRTGAPTAPRRAGAA